MMDMSIMFSSPGFISMLLMGIIYAVSVFGAIIWAVIHIARGKFHEEYEIAVPEYVEEKSRG